MQKIHLKSPRNWMNDPNGFIWYKGQYHMFYQHFPFEPRWGTMYWGHAVSPDLVHWEHKDIALYPSRYDDQNGCFSGSAVEHDGRLYLYYTGVHYEMVDPQDCHHCVDDRYISAQMLQVSEDGEHFDNRNQKYTVVPPIEDPRIGCRNHTRDPKVWRGKDAWYMLLGSRTEEGKGKLLFYRSQDLLHWSFVNDATKNADWGWMWECPDYFEIGQDKVLTISPMGILNDGKLDPNQTICMRVEFDEESCTMRIPDTYQYMDYGRDLYATQSNLDKDGRRVVFAWVRMPEPAPQGWIGMFAVPRVATVRDGHICFGIHPDIRKAFHKKITSPREAGEAGYRLETELEDGEEIDIGGYRIFRRGNRVCTDRSRVFRGHTEYRSAFETPEIKGGCRLEICVDPNLIEVFVNDGEYTVTNAVYDLGDEIRTEHPEKITLWTV